MNTIDILSIAPLLIILLTALVLLLVESFCAFWIAIAGVSLALIATLYAPESANPLLAAWVKYDALAKFFNCLFLIIGLASCLLASAFFSRFQATRSEYYFLLLSALFGLMLIGSSADFLTLFLGVETLSLSLYVMCGYMKKWEMSGEAALKYFLMGSLAAAFLLYGIALIYGATGTTSLTALVPSASPLFLGGIALVTLALAFEAALVPFHIWAPDVYDGAPTPVTAFMAVGTKAGAFAAFSRIILHDPLWSEGIALLAIPSLIYANFVAMRQTQLRRFFAYSGISQAGFLLLPIAAGSQSALLFYLIVYSLATLGCFAVLALLDKNSEGVTLNDLSGLFFRAPWLAGFFALCLLTLAGIPPTAGFFAKFYLFKVAFEAGYYALVVIALLTTLLAAYYYVRLIAIMLSEEAEEAAAPRNLWPAMLVGGVSLAALLWLSCYPEPLIKLLT